MKDLNDYLKSDEEKRKMGELVFEEQKLIHAVQSGVKACIENNLSFEAQPKHLRVGVSNSIIMISALELLLYEKGVMTPLEYHELYVRLLQQEKSDYEQKLSAHFNVKIDLA